MSNSKFETKLIVNGAPQECRAKQITTVIKGSNVTLNMAYIHEVQLSEAVYFNYNAVANNPDVTVECAKVGNKVTGNLLIKGKPVFTCLSMQAVFAVVQAAYGQSVSTSNNLYVKSNPTRKQSAIASAKATIVVEQGVL